MLKEADKKTVTWFLNIVLIIVGVYLAYTIAPIVKDLDKHETRISAVEMSSAINYNNYCHIKESLYDLNTKVDKLLESRDCYSQTKIMP